MLALDLPVRGGPLLFQSSENQVALLELFTSEGCSSCPPAEKWLSSLKSAPGLWKEFVPVAFHVDYWDYLGWRDPWGSNTFSDRQRDYAQSWGRDSIYTPGFVLSGQEWRTWSLPKNGPHPELRKVGSLKAESADNQRWLVSFLPAGQNVGDYQVHAAVLESGLVSNVKSGENRGNRLNHDFVAKSLVSTPLRKQGDHLQAEFGLKIEANPNSRLGIAFWVTAVGKLEPVQAVGGWLSN